MVPVLRRIAVLRARTEDNRISHEYQAKAVLREFGVPCRAAYRHSP